MIKVGVIGFGHWGKVLHQKLLKICHVDFICQRNDSYIDKLGGIDWVVVATPNETHYQIVSDCLALGINVFCEKPLALTKKNSDKLYTLAKENSANLYVSDVQNYIDISYIFIRDNFVERFKYTQGADYKIRDLLYRLAYHDIYFLYKHINQRTMKDILFLDCKNKLHFKLVFDDGVNIDFLYDIEHEGGIKHHINGSDMRKGLIPDPLHNMLKKVLHGRVDWEYNKKVTLFANDIIDKINEKI